MLRIVDFRFKVCLMKAHKLDSTNTQYLFNVPMGRLGWSVSLKVLMISQQLLLFIVKLTFQQLLTLHLEQKQQLLLLLDEILTTNHP